jgi:diacylglycerol kinase
MKHQKSTIGIREALWGLLYTLRTQNNFKIQIITAILVLNLGIFFRITKAEWLILLLVMALVLVSEIINTGLESTVDLTVSDLNPIAKIVKDTAAGAVLVASLFAIAIGTIIFLPYLQVFLAR